MKIVVSFKVVPDDQDIIIAPDGSLDCTKAHQIVSVYDLNAIEVAAQLAEKHDASLFGISAGPAAIDDSKMKKNVLARGVDELFLAADDTLAHMDARATAEALAALLQKIGNYDLVVCGDGSADNYAQQTEVQLAARLGLAVITSATKVEVIGNTLRVERTLEDVVEVVETMLPAIVSVTPDAALPRIPGMKDILAAGKKPTEVASAKVVVDDMIKVIECRAPEQARRNLTIWDASDVSAIEDFAAALRANI